MIDLREDVRTAITIANATLFLDPRQLDQHSAMVASLIVDAWPEAETDLARLSTALHAMTMLVIHLADELDRVNNDDNTSDTSVAAVLAGVLHRMYPPSAPDPGGLDSSGL